MASERSNLSAIVFDEDTELLGVLGEGGMGVVYKAYQKSFQRHVAVKAMRPQICSDREDLQRFLNEARAQGTLNHPNIVRTYSLGNTPDNRPYIIMEYVEGETLAQIMSREGPLPVHRIVALFKPLLEGLVYAHSHGCVHRDLKPSNVMVTADGGIRIMDFGIAKMASVSQALTGTGEVLGSPAYMSPEQARSVRDVDSRSDLYSVSAMLFEALEGKTPFEAGATVELLVRLLNEAPPAVTRGNVRLAELIARGLAKAPGERWQTAQQMLDELVLAGDDTRPVAIAAVQTVPQKARPKLQSTALAALCILIALAFGGFAMYQHHLSEVDRSSAEKTVRKAAALEEILSVVKKDAGLLYDAHSTKSQRESAEREAFELLQEAERIAAEQKLSTQRLFGIKLHRANVVAASGRSSDALTEFNAAIGMVTPDDALVRSELFAGLQSRALCETKLGLHARALADMREAERLFDTYMSGYPGNKDRQQGMYEHFVSYFASVSDYANCLKYAQKELAAAKESGNPSNAIIAQMYVGCYLCKLGDYKTGIPMLEESTRLYRQHYAEAPSVRATIDFSHFLGNLIRAYRDNGRTSDALRLAQYLKAAQTWNANNKAIPVSETQSWSL